MYLCTDHNDKTCGLSDYLSGGKSRNQSSPTLLPQTRNEWGLTAKDHYLSWLTKSARNIFCYEILGKQRILNATGFSLLSFTQYVSQQFSINSSIKLLNNLILFDP